MFAFNGDFVLKSLHSRRLILFLILIQISRIIFITALVVTLSKQKTSDYERVTQKLTQTSNNIFLRSLVSAFYYPNIKFMYAEGIPDVKSVKQSAYKLQAVLANRR